MTEEEFAAYAAARVDSAQVERQQGELPGIEGLYLACACARGDGAALVLFEAEFFTELAAIVASVGGAAPSADELRQVLRHKLFVGDEREAPKITAFSGRGPLKSWVRMVALRTAINIAARAGRELPSEPPTLMLLIGAGEDPEIEYFRRLYADEFRAAFSEAFAALEPRDKNLLAYAFGERLTVDAIGAIYGVHRATAARWVAKAHAHLVGEVKTKLAARLRLNDDELASVLRLIQSRLELSLSAVLATGARAAAP